MNPANFDFHCHSSVSDGLLPPAELVRRAASNGVTWLALTDHDDLSGLGEAAAAAQEAGIDFSGGVEISIEWQGIPIHVVGLGIKGDCPQLQAGLQTIRNGRVERARRMEASLAAAGIEGCFDGAMRYAENPSLISRAHFARYMVEIGIAQDTCTIFHHYLTPGKPGYVDHRWATLEESVGWILAAGGVAVVAHPGRYRFANGGQRAFLSEFKELGGQGIEVVCGCHGNDNVQHFARLVRHFGLYASRGSDFHGPEESYIDLGKLAALPEDLKPVWRLMA
ncbi:MAG: hypothetical protein H6R18_2727 [Proteobacteria bacterium]|nr:hypothetical protein [Pseudomonadota bacterium]